MPDHHGGIAIGPGLYDYVRWQLQRILCVLYEPGIPGPADELNFGQKTFWCYCRAQSSKTRVRALIYETRDCVDWRRDVGGMCS